MSDGENRDEGSDPTPKYSKFLTAANNVLQSFFLGLKAIFDFEVGITPARIRCKQFGAAFLGAYSGMVVLGIAWLSAKTLWKTLWEYLESLTTGAKILFSVVALILVVPAILSLPVAWLIAGSSTETSTLLTLFARALSFVILFFIFLLAVTKLLVLL